MNITPSKNKDILLLKEQKNGSFYDYYVQFEA